MNLLVFTSDHRTREITVPLEATDADVEYVVADSEEQPLRRAYSVFREGREILRNQDVDLVVLDSFDLTGLPGVLLAKRFGVPAVCRMVVDGRRELTDEKIVRSLATTSFGSLLTYLVGYGCSYATFSMADGFIALSGGLKSKVVQRYDPPPERVSVVPLSVHREQFFADGGDGGGDSDAFADSGASEFDFDTEYIVLTVTNLAYQNKYRGVRETVDELADLLAEREDVSYVVAGDGYYREKLLRYLDERIDDPSVRDRIHVLGFVENVADLYETADVFTYVSYLDGYPNVVLEAQTAGLPVVANPAHGMLDQISNWETGVFVDPAEEGSIRSTVEFVLKHDDERRRIGDNAKREVATKNDPETIGERLVTAFDRVRS